MNIELLANLSYIVSAALFIFGLKMLGHPDSARNGNLLSAVGMFIAIVVTLFSQRIVSFEFIVIAMVAGTIVGAWMWMQGGAPAPPPPPLPAPRARAPLSACPPRRRPARPAVVFCVTRAATYRSLLSVGLS